MKNKGFTLIEVIVSFVLVAIISVFLFQVVISLKTIFLAGDIKTTMLNKQGIITQKIYNDIDENNLISVDSCQNEENCALFTYSSQTKKLKIDKQNRIIAYDDYTIKLDQGSIIGNVTISKISTNGGNLFILKAPVQHKLFDGDFGIDIVIKTENSVTISNVTFN